MPNEHLNDPAWAWAPYTPDHTRPWNLQLAGHLFRRAAFGGTWSELTRALEEGPQRTIARLLRPAAEVAAFNRRLDAYERSTEANELRAWWLRRMLETPHPLLEMTTLFWHRHFALSNARVNNARLMNRYVQLLRRHALGRFDVLLGELFSEPAMHLGLNSESNRAARPNEFLARTVLEEFTLGRNHTTDQDVREAARAFTGWFVLREELRFFSREHDSGVKQVLGRQGAFDAQELVRLLLDQPATSERIVAKLYQWFISETSPPPPDVLEPLAATFASDYNLAKVIETMLRSNLFFSAAAYRQKIKSPVEFALGIIRPFSATVGTLRLASDLADLGQDLFQPPTISGWAGGPTWINRFTIAGRSRLAQSLLASSGRYAGNIDPFAVAAQHDRTTVETASQLLLDLLLQDHAPENVRALFKNPGAFPGKPAEQLRQVAALITSLPEFHLA